MSRRALAAISLACLACGSATDNGPVTISLEGSWNYAAIQAAPAANLTGTLRVEDQNSATFVGTIQFTETDAQGGVRNRTGDVSGRVIGSDVVDFDMDVEGVSRRHVGLMQGDSIAGTWATTTGPAMLSGSFKAKRRP